jgi:predicted nucleic acid-binding protein
MIIIVDSDGLIGISNPEDVHYLSCIKLLQNLKKLNAILIYPATTIAESTAVLQIRLNKSETADQIIELTKSGVLLIEPVDQAILAKAASFLGKDRSKHATIFDGIVAAIARKHQADGIFSFDKFYKKKGFKLASEL